MNTHIHDHSDRTHEDDSLDLSTIYPMPDELSFNKIVAKALLKNIPLFLITLCLIFLVACTSNLKHETAGEYIDDSMITAKVKAALVADNLPQAADVNVETYHGVVKLSGFVRSMDAQNEAVKIAKSIEGVESVTNHMHVR